jgi:cysteine desulfurase
MVYIIIHILKKNTMFSRIFKKKIYADYATLTPIDGRVLKVMVSIYKDFDKNPGALYSGAVLAKKKLEEVRKKVAETLSNTSSNSVHADEIVFTSGGTESNNMAIQGVIDAWYTTHKEIPCIVTSTIEHPAVKKVIDNLVNKKLVTVSYIPVLPSGVIDFVYLRNVFETENNIVLVSIMLVNNEIGVIQSLSEIAKIIRYHKKKNNSIYPYFHTDGCQAPCYIDMHIDKMGVDLLSLDGGKIYGPRGVGCLYIKRGVKIQGVMYGGGQEFGLRPGTENLPAICGFEQALYMAYAQRKDEVLRLGEMQQYVYKNLPAGVFVNGTTLPGERVVNNINICKKGKDAEFVVFQMDTLGVEVSAVTACQNVQEESRSYVVDALGQDCGASSLRISFGRHTTWSEVRKVVKLIQKIYTI